MQHSSEALLNSKTNSSKTPLHYAVAASSFYPTALDCLELLLSYSDLDHYAKDEEGRTALSIGCEMGADLAVELLLNATPEVVNVEDVYKRTALHWAVSGEAPVNVVRTLLEFSKIKVNTFDNTGLSPLHLAALNNLPEVISMLTNARGALTSMDFKGRTLLHAAVAGNAPDAFSYLVNQNFNVNVLDKAGRSPIYYAVYTDQHLMLQLLLQSNAMINIRDNDNTTPLYWACFSDAEKCVEILLEAGADAQIFDNHKRSPLHAAAHQASSASFAMLLSKTTLQLDCKDALSNTPLHILCAQGHDYIISNLVPNISKELLNSTNESGRTPLHLAVIFGHFNTVKLLLKHGADPNRRDAKQRNVFHLTLLNPTIDPAELLKHLCTICTYDIGEQDKYGRTVLHMICAFGLEHSFELVLKCNVNINCKDNDGYTALHFAAHYGHARLVERLIVLKAEILSNNIGRTPLHAAVVQSNMKDDAVLLALMNNESVNMQDAKGRTPLHYAAALDRPRIFDLLAESNMSQKCYSVKDLRGLNVFHYAAAKGSFRVLEILAKVMKENEKYTQDNEGRTAVHLFLLNIKYLGDENILNSIDLLRPICKTLECIKDSKGKTPFEYFNRLKFTPQIINIFSDFFIQSGVSVSVP